MGATGSHEVVVAGGPLPIATASQQPALGAGASADEAGRRRAEEAFRAAEATIYQEGYRQGAAEAAAHFAGGAQLAVKAAISRALVEEEGRRSQALEEAVAALRKTQYRAPQKPLECQAEEAAVLACHAAAADCAPAIDAYARCAKAVVDSRMHPKLG